VCQVDTTFSLKYLFSLAVSQCRVDFFDLLDAKVSVWAKTFEPSSDHWVHLNRVLQKIDLLRCEQVFFVCLLGESAIRNAARGNVLREVKIKDVNTAHRGVSSGMTA